MVWCKAYFNIRNHLGMMVGQRDGWTEQRDGWMDIQIGSQSVRN